MRMGLEVIVPGDGSDGSEFFGLHAGDSRQELSVEAVTGRGKVGIPLAVVSNAKVSCSACRAQCWDDAMEQRWSNFASRVFQRRSCAGAHQNINPGQL